MPQTDAESVIQSFADAKELMPFLISLTAKDRKQKYPFARRKDMFAKESLLFAQRNPNHVPAAIHVADWQKDQTILDQLTLIKRHLETLDLALADTILALRAETAKTAFFMYKMLEILDKNGVPDIHIGFEKLKKSRGNLGGKKKKKTEENE